MNNENYGEASNTAIIEKTSPKSKYRENKTNDTIAPQDSLKDRVKDPANIWWVTFINILACTTMILITKYTCFIVGIFAILNLRFFLIWSSCERRGCDLPDLNSSKIMKEITGFVTKLTKLKNKLPSKQKEQNTS